MFSSGTSSGKKAAIRFSPLANMMAETVTKIIPIAISPGPTHAKLAVAEIQPIEEINKKRFLQAR